MRPARSATALPTPKPSVATTLDDLQSWWEVPSIAHFCSLFRAAFDLLDFDIEELEEAFLAQESEVDDDDLLQLLIVRLLNGCLERNDITLQNYEKFLRDVIEERWSTVSRRLNPLSDLTFQALPLRTKVEIVHTLCDYRLDAGDVADVLKNLESDSLRVEPLGKDDQGFTYWYFYGTRLYREESQSSLQLKRKQKANEKSKPPKKAISKRGREQKPSRRSRQAADSEAYSVPSASSTGWSAVCSTEEDWRKFADQFKKSRSKCERELYKTVVEDFLPEIGNMLAEREKHMRKRMTDMAPRRASTRIEKLKQQKNDTCLEEQRKSAVELQDRLRQQDEERREAEAREREERAIERSLAKEERSKRAHQRKSNSSNAAEMPIPSPDAHNSKFIMRRRIKSSSLFIETEEDLCTGMYKVFETLQGHPDAWPFLQPVEEEYAPSYSKIVKRPIDLSIIERKLQNREYFTRQEFEADVMLMFDNCRKYNGADSEYTKMADKLRSTFKKALAKAFLVDMSDDEDYVVEVSIPRHKQSRPKPAIGMKAIDALAQAAEVALQEAVKRGNDDDTPTLSSACSSPASPCSSIGEKSTCLPGSPNNVANANEEEEGRLNIVFEPIPSTSSVPKVTKAPIRPSSAPSRVVVGQGLHGRFTIKKETDTKPAKCLSPVTKERERRPGGSTSSASFTREYEMAKPKVTSPHGRVTISRLSGNTYAVSLKTPRSPSSALSPAREKPLSVPVTPKTEAPTPSDDATVARGVGMHKLPVTPAAAVMRPAAKMASVTPTKKEGPRVLSKKSGGLSVKEPSCSERDTKLKKASDANSDSVSQDSIFAARCEADALASQQPIHKMKIPKLKIVDGQRVVSDVVIPTSDEAPGASVSAIKKEPSGDSVTCMNKEPPMTLMSVSGVSSNGVANSVAVVSDLPAVPPKPLTEKLPSTTCAVPVKKRAYNMDIIESTPISSTLGSLHPPSVSPKETPTIGAKKRLLADSSSYNALVVNSVQESLPVLPSEMAKESEVQTLNVLRKTVIATAPSEGLASKLQQRLPGDLDVASNGFMQVGGERRTEVIERSARNHYNISVPPRGSRVISSPPPLVPSSAFPSASTDCGRPTHLIRARPRLIPLAGMVDSRYNAPRQNVNLDLHQYHQLSRLPQHPVRYPSLSNAKPETLVPPSTTPYILPQPTMVTTPLNQNGVAQQRFCPLPGRPTT